MPSVWLGVTEKGPDVALSSVTVNSIPSPSSAEASSMVTAGGTWSSSVIVPVAVPVAVTVAEVPDTLRATVKVSSDSSTLSSVVATVKGCVSPAVPAKLIPTVFSS